MPLWSGEWARTQVITQDQYKMSKAMDVQSVLACDIEPGGQRGPGVIVSFACPFNTAKLSYWRCLRHLSSIQSPSPVAPIIVTIVYVNTIF